MKAFSLLLQTNVTWSAEAKLKSYDRSGHLHNHQHHLQEEANTRGNSDRKTTIEQDNQIERRKQVGDGNSLDHHVPHRKVLREDGRIYHESVGARGQRQTFEQDIYLGGKPNQDVDHFQNVDDGNNRKPHEQGMVLDRPKRIDRTNHLESCKYYDRNGRNGRSGRVQKGRFL